MRVRSHLAFVLAISLSSLATACSSPNGGCPSGAICDTGAPSGPVHGVTSDGRVDVSAGEAWPSRPVEPGPLTERELAEACEIEGACALDPDTNAPYSDETVSFLVALCVGPSSSEERVIPETNSNERTSWKHRAAIAAAGDCAKVRSIVTDAPTHLYCEEDGCWWSGGSTPVPKVTCAGDVASLTFEGRTVTRDCTHAYTRCDPTSATGCTDRKTTACTSGAHDRCDGDIKLGCDGTGRVSYHDCTRYPGGHCVESAGGAKCVYADASACDATPQKCDGDVLSLCVNGATQTVDCKAIGLAGCRAARCYAP